MKFKIKSEATDVASPRKQSGKEQQKEFTEMVEQMVKSMEKVFGDKIQLEVEPKIPIKINKNAVVGAGSVITEDVKENSLSIERSEQEEIENYKRKK